MATLIDAAEFTSNEVYQIQATDRVEGAASGASFSGTGISNQPHQQLANRTAFLKQRQDVNISNIGVLQAFQALFTGLMAQNGYLKIPVADINKGLIQYFIQWGLVNWGTKQSEGLYGPYPFNAFAGFRLRYANSSKTTNCSVNDRHSFTHSY